MILKTIANYTYLNPVIVSICNDELPNSVDCYACQTVKFSFLITVLTKFFQESTIGIEDLDTMVR